MPQGSERRLRRLRRLSGPGHQFSALASQLLPAVVILHVKTDLDSQLAKITGEDGYLFAGSRTAFHGVTPCRNRQVELAVWIIVYLPFDAAEVWGMRGQIKVKGEVNGFQFRTSLFPTREGRHILLVNKRMQKGARAAQGSVASFQIELDREDGW